MVRKGSPVRVRQRPSALRRGLRVSVRVQFGSRVHSASNLDPFSCTEGVKRFLDPAFGEERGNEECFALQGDGEALVRRPAAAI
jgi:hypothetical protein